MPFELPLPSFLKQARWKVKIRDKERCEPPHVTLLRSTFAWRIDLRSGEFLDSQPDPAEVPMKLLDLVRDAENWSRLRNAWDELYPENPVQESPERDSE